MTPPTPDDTAAEPWGSLLLADGEERSVALGPLTLHLARAGGEVHLAHERADEESPPGTEPGRPSEGEPDWSRWATVAKWEGELALRPTFPDRPLVVAPEDPFHLLAGAEARIYVRVPLQVTVQAVSEGRRADLATLPTIPASDTWWGTVDDGELCYWLTTLARRSVSADLFEPHLAMCPLHLVNRSADDLTVEKIAVRVAYLTLFASGRQIWADETRVRYQGDAEGSRLEMAGRPPAEAAGARLLAEAREPMGRGFRARTFARLRQLPRWMA